MDTISRETIKIDWSEKEITVTNHTTLYKAIKSGAVVPLLPLESLQAAAECMDPTVGWFTGILVRIVEATYLYHVFEWTVTGVRSLQMPAEGLSIVGPSINIE